MTVNLTSPEKEVNRKRRAHTKSRRGCGNCKLRRVKCDENKPRCKRCKAFSVSCNYDSTSSDLQLWVDGAFNLEIPQELPSLNRSMLGMINTSLKPHLSDSPEIMAAYQLHGQDLELLNKFQTRTVLTIGTDKTSQVGKAGIIRSACLNPFLMHVVLAFTLMHDRYLSNTPNSKRSTAEAFHWYKGTALLNSTLSKPVQPGEEEALWAAASLLGAIAFFCVEANTPEEAWPLSPPSSLDLEWLRMGEGKKEILKIVDPSRSNSVLQEIIPEHEAAVLSTQTSGLEFKALPSEFIELYALNATSTPANNPYHAAASILARLLNIECNRSTILKFMSFTGQMQPDFKRLLERKDPRALLMLAYWYAKLAQYRQWWILPRPVLEGQAICIYLERYYGNVASIRKLLQFPRMKCGLGAC